MSAVQYPFIDIAAHPRVRDHFAAGKAVVLFSHDMADVLWANGRGAQLFGTDIIYDLIDQGPPRLDLTVRQAQATARQLRAPGDQRTFMMRMTSGFERLAVQALCELIELADGETGVLLAVPASAQPPLAADCARQMLEGFDDPNTHVAVLDGDGHVISASADFGSINLTPHTARMLVTLAAHEGDRLVKRPVPTGAGYLPAAIARLSDTPVLNLLFIVEADGEPAIASEERPPAPIAGEIAPAGDLTDRGMDLRLEADEPPASLGLEETIAADDAAQEALTPEGDVEAPMPSPVIAAAVSAEPTIALEVPTETGEDALAAHDGSADDSAADDIAPETPASGFLFRREARATRFVWKIDAQGVFCEVSAELAATVGPHAAEVVGLGFGDVAALFNLDPDGKIGELLQRRDTWSGKTIYWPVEGTSLCVPIDLAALPTYTRTREFDGFRGFGIVRISDVEEDPLALGLTLVPEASDQTTEIEDAAADLPETEVDHADETTIADVTDEVADLVELEAEAAPAGSTDEAETTQQPAQEPGTADDAPEEMDDAEQSTSAAQPSTMPLLWPAHEKPALRLVENTPRYSDKIIRIEERRPGPGAREGLTPVEQAAFREIARRLEVFRQNEEPLEQPHSAASLALEDDAAHGAEPDDAGLSASEEALAVPAEASLAAEVEAAVDIPPSEDTQEQVETEQADETDDLSDEALYADMTDAAEDAHLAQTETETEAEPHDTLDADQADIDQAALADMLAETVPAEDMPLAAVAVAPETAGTEDTTDTAAADEDAASAPAEDGIDADGEERISLAEAYAQAMPLRQRPELSPDVVDQMPVALLVHSGERLIHANPEFLRLTGYETLDALAEVGGLDALLQTQELEDKTSEAGGMVVVRADDSLVPVTARLQSVRWDGATALILALMPVNETVPAHDSAPVDDAAPAEPDDNALQAEKLSRMAVEVDELRAILDTATDGVVILGGDGDIRSMNRAASALFNYDNDETAGKPFVMLFAHESQKSVLDYLAGLAGHGVASLLNDGREVIGREASGGFLPLFMTIGHLTSSNGYCAVIRDITQWKRTEEELRNAKRAAETANAHKSDFLAHVSHEIRTPLNAIIGFADMMATERLGPIGHQRYVEYANDIGRSGRHVLDIVNDLLDISKIEAGEMELDFAAVGLNETVAEAVSLVQPQANGQRVIIRTALSHAVPPVVADLRSIKQIVLNILANAIRFTPSGGQIVVSTAYEANGNVVLRIRDTGIGMTRSELELAMKPFRQVAGGTRKRGDGTGLGLPLTKAMVDANRAAFSIHSAPNEGTLVEVTFPSPRVLAN
jgi:PAS domain S-box-containing protein